MGRVSRRKINVLVEERMFELFWLLLSTLSKRDDVKEFITSLLSYTEQVMLAKRLAIALMLARQYTYEAISEHLKVSTATVSTVHKALLVGSVGYTKAINILERQKQTEAFWDKIEELLLKLSMPAAEGSNQFQLKSSRGKHLYQRKIKHQTI